MQTNYLAFRPRRPRIHCSIDVLFHAGVLWLTHAVGATRVKSGQVSTQVRQHFNVKVETPEAAA